MDATAILAIVVLLAAFIIPIFLLFKTQGSEKAKADAAESAVQAREAAALAKKQAKLERGQGKKKKGALSRMEKTKGSGLAAEAAAADDDDDDDDDDGDAGTRKDQRKADKKAQHREQVEARNAQIEAVREQESEKDAKRRAKDAEREAKQAAREEAERLKAEAIAKQKQEEYDKWKDMFTVDEVGEDGGADVEEEGLLERFIGYMEEHKVTVLEELAAEFKLKVGDVIDRVQALERMGHVTGVIDDRGKFIYITPDEMEAVAKYVHRKGRVRISTLAMESNKLIDLEAKKTQGDDMGEEQEEHGTSATQGGEAATGGG